MKQNQYEITYLIDPKLSEDERGAVDSSVNELVEKSEGSIASPTPTLRKKLAYDIKKNNAAFMRVVSIDLDPAKIADIHDFLKRNTNILRFTILATPHRTRMSQEIMDKYSKRKGKESAAPAHEKKVPEVKKKAKEVTMQDVEKGIEEALTEEVK